MQPKTQPIPVAGSTFYDPNTGKAAGINQFDPNTGKPLTPGATTGGSKYESFISALQTSLLDSSGMISSNSSDIEKRINNSIESIRKGTEAGNQAIASRFDREAGYTTDKFNEDQIAGREQGSGGLMAFAALKKLTGDTDKNLKDLAQRREELILQNNAAGADKIADLEIKQIEFKQKAQQEFFSQLMGLTNLSLNVDQSARQDKQMEDNKIADIGKLLSENPQAGIKITDSIEEAYRKIGVNPNSPDMLYKKAQIENIYSEMRKRNQATGTVEAGTETERKAAKMSSFMTLLTPGAKLTNGEHIFKAQEIMVNGKKMLDNFITPSAFATLSKSAIANGIDRKDFIASVSGLIYKGKNNKTIDDSYRLTPADLKIINGK